MHLLTPHTSFSLVRSAFYGVLAAALSVAIISCNRQAPTAEISEKLTGIVGTWVLNARIVEGEESEVTYRFMRLSVAPGGTFKAEYRGDASQAWISAGRGAVSYAPPIMTLYWDSGAVTTLMVTEIEPDKIRVRHGRNLVPLKNQEPDEIFVRQKIEKGPTQKPA